MRAAEATRKQTAPRVVHPGIDAIIEARLRCPPSAGDPVGFYPDFS